MLRTRSCSPGGGPVSNFRLKALYNAARLDLNGLWNRLGIQSIVSEFPFLT